MTKTEQDYLFKLGQKIESKYREKYSSLSEFASVVECDNRTIRRIVRGEQNPTILIVKRISVALDISLGDLLND